MIYSAAASGGDITEAGMAYGYVYISPSFILRPLIGGAVGGRHKKYYIRHIYHTYQQLRPELDKYAIANFYDPN